MEEAIAACLASREAKALALLAAIARMETALSGTEISVSTAPSSMTPQTIADLEANAASKKAQLIET